jgi:hypothetical protein
LLRNIEKRPSVLHLPSVKRRPHSGGETAKGLHERIRERGVLPVDALGQRFAQLALLGLDERDGLLVDDVIDTRPPWLDDVDAGRAGC